MFFYDKDMERMMQLKKQEIMREMETAKKRILEELNCVKRSVHTDFCDLLADYNRIDFQMKKLLATFKEELAKLTTGYSDLISLKFAEYNDMVVDKVEQLEILEREIELFFSNKLAELETMQTTVQGLIDKLGNVGDDIVTLSILNQMLSEFEGTVNGIFAEINQTIQSLDEANTADHTAIRKEFADADAAIRQEFANADNEILEEMEANNAELMEQILAAQVQSDWNENDENNKAHVLNRTHYGGYSDETVLLSGTLADYKIEYPYKSSGKSYKHFLLPIDVTQIKEGDMVTIELDAIVTNWVAQRANIVSRELAFNESSSGTHTVPKSNALIGGNFQTDSTSGIKSTIPEGLSLNEAVFFAFKDTEMYLCVYANSDPALAETFKISLRKYRAEKVLAPMYTGHNDCIGGVLVRDAIGPVWKRLPFVEYSKIEVVKTDTVDLTFNKETSSWVYFDLVRWPNVPETGFVEIYGVYEPYETVSGEIRIDGDLQVKFAAGKLTLKATATHFKAIKNALGEEYVNGITVNFYSYEEVKYGGNLTPEYVAANPSEYAVPVIKNGVALWSNDVYVKSPNGTIFKLSVTDSGELSATAVSS